MIVLYASSALADDLTFTPISHATFALQAGQLTVYVDPVGAAESFAKLPPPDLILVTHIHKDHLSPAVIEALKQDNTAIVGPPTVIEQLGYGEAMNNGDRLTIAGVELEAIPAYNLTEERLKFHPQGRDNGYVVTVAGKRIYISGDTEDIVEMRALKDIDYAFLCMNLPYTMDVAQAASATLAFKPGVVIPYHYRGTGGMSDIDRFAELVSVDAGVEVRKLKWY
jgi:L-ascorbate metabolism protein UlaG (beta-lactamase superfamily)